MATSLTACLLLHPPDCRPRWSQTMYARDENHPTRGSDESKLDGTRVFSVTGPLPGLWRSPAAVDCRGISSSRKMWPDPAVAGSGLFFCRWGFPVRRSRRKLAASLGGFHTKPWRSCWRSGRRLCAARPAARAVHGAHRRTLPEGPGDLRRRQSAACGPGRLRRRPHRALLRPSQHTRNRAALGAGPARGGPPGASSAGAFTSCCARTTIARFHHSGQNEQLYH